MEKTDSKTTRAKLFLNGRSQAVRLPKEYRFEGAEVEIHREGDRVILEPVRKRGWPKGYWERLSRLAVDFDVQPIEPLPPGSERESLDEE